MTVVDLLLMAWVGASIFVAQRRWAWVAQLEHYIPGSCLQTWKRWVDVRPANWLAFLGPLVLLPLGGVAAALAVAAIVLGAPLLALVPLPMMRDPRALGLTVTARVKRLLSVSTAVLTVATVALGALLTTVDTPYPFAGAALLTCALSAPLMDVALRLALPLEKRDSEGFRVQAETKLRQVDPLTIAITGSYGKTSTKNHLRDLITGAKEVLATPASWNNTNGLSRAINEQLHPDVEVFIAEMGTYGPGEIADMCAWVTPSIVAISAIGPMHLERMGSLDGVLRAKREILIGARTAALWVDDVRLRGLADEVDGQLDVLRVGTHDSREGLDVTVEEADGRIVVRRSDGDGGFVDVGSCTAGGGLHAGNIGLAVALAGAAGVDDAHVGSRLAAMQPPPHRSVVSTTPAGVVVIDNTFNANPDGAAEAIDVLADAAPGRRVVVTPGMVELGPLAREANQALGRAVVESGAELVVVGRVNRAALTAGAAGGTVQTVDAREEARVMLRASLAKGDGVLWLNDLPPHYP